MRPLRLEYFPSSNRFFDESYWSLFLNLDYFFYKIMLVCSTLECIILSTFAWQRVKRHLVKRSVYASSLTPFFSKSDPKYSHVWPQIPFNPHDLKCFWNRKDRSGAYCADISHRRVVFTAGQLPSRRKESILILSHRLWILRCNLFDFDLSVI